MAVRWLHPPLSSKKSVPISMSMIIAPEILILLSMTLGALSNSTRIRCPIYIKVTPEQATLKLKGIPIFGVLSLLK